MLYREIMAVFSQIHTKHINTLCGQNVELLNVKPVAHRSISVCDLLKQHGAFSGCDWRRRVSRYIGDRSECIQ